MQCNWLLGPGTRAGRSSIKNAECEHDWPATRNELVRRGESSPIFAACGLREAARQARACAKRGSLHCPARQPRGVRSHRGSILDSYWNEKQVAPAGPGLAISVHHRPVDRRDCKPVIISQTRVDKEIRQDAMILAVLGWILQLLHHAMQFSVCASRRVKQNESSLPVLLSVSVRRQFLGRHMRRKGKVGLRQPRSLERERAQ